MEYYGNQIWNTATPSIRKATLLMDKDAFHTLQQQLERYQMNYYAAEKNGKVKMVINYSDSQEIQNLLGKETASRIHWISETKRYIPPSFNIIGNTNYYDIPDKNYIRGSTDILLQAAKQLEEQGISFSGRIYTHKRGTITVNNADQELVLNIYNQIAAQRQEQHRQAAEQETITISLPNLPQKELDAIQPFLNKSGITYSVHTDANDYGVFSIAQKDASRFYQELILAKNLSEIHKDLQEAGFSEQQTQTLEPLISFCAAHEAEGSILLNYMDFLNPEYTEQQLNEISDLFIAYHSQSISDQLAPHNERLEELKQMKAQFEANITLHSIVRGHHYQDDQKAALFQAIQSDLPHEMLSELDESYTAKEIHSLIQVYETYDMGKIQDFFTKHHDRMAEQELSKPFTSGAELAEKSKLNDKAAEGNKIQQTFYFDMARLRKLAQQVPKEASKQKQKGKNNPEVG